MPQRLKPEVRDAILRCAAEVFAEKGYKAASLAEIGERAEVTTSNIYKYFANKQALLDAVVTPSLAAELLWLLRRRLRTLASRQSWNDEAARQDEVARALLTFWLENRHAVVFLLKGASDTRFDRVRGLFEQEMFEQSLRVQRRQGQVNTSRTQTVVLRQIFASTVDTIVTILSCFDSTEDVAEAVEIFRTYQTAGLEALIKNIP